MTISPIRDCRRPIGVPRIPPLLEQLFLEERRQTKTIPHAFGKRAVLKLMFAPLDRASRSWQRVAITDFELRQLETLREDIHREFDEKLASHSNIYSKTGLDLGYVT